MRLIDADKLIQELETDSLKMLAKYHEEDYGPYYGGVLSAMQEVIKNIEKKPNAYDADKVVEQLNSLKRYSNPYDNYYEEANYRATEYENSVTNRVVDAVIKIVKAGGNA